MKNIYPKLLCLALVFTLSACLPPMPMRSPGSEKIDPIVITTDPQKISEMLAEFEGFVCKHAPKYTNNGEENFSLYNYAKYIALHSGWEGENVWAEVLPYLRIAAANGDTLANLYLQENLFRKNVPKSLAPNIATEVMNLNDQLLAQNLPIAYYLKSKYIYRKYEGIYKGNEKDIANYLRKAADFGDKDAQNDMADKLFSEIHLSMIVRKPYLRRFLNCAAEQGHAKAGIYESHWFKDEQKYAEAMRYLHLSAKADEAKVDSFEDLEMAFIITEAKRRKYFFNLTVPDKERSRRYGIIAKYIEQHSRLKPSVPDLDEIVPLPPAKLPKWDGKIAFQRWYEGPTPPKPSEELVNRLTAKHNLDPKTGLPIKASH